MCKVSIIIPYFNSQNTIERCLESATNQTYKDFEIILINDGSKDNSKQIVDNFIEHEKRYKIINIEQNNKGPSAARNKGINIAQGKYIAFLDSDDTWESNKIEKQIFQMEESQIDLLGCNYNIIKGNRVIKKYFTHGRINKISFYKLLYKHYFMPSCVVVKKDIFLKSGGFPENQKYMEDALTFTRIARYANASIISDFLVNAYKLPYGESGLSGNLQKMEKYELLNFKILRKENGWNEKKMSIILYCTINIFSLCKYVLRILVTKFFRI